MSFNIPSSRDKTLVIRTFSVTVSLSLSLSLSFFFFYKTYTFASKLLLFVYLFVTFSLPPPICCSVHVSRKNKLDESLLCAQCVPLSLPVFISVYLSGVQFSWGELWKSSFKETWFSKDACDSAAVSRGLSKVTPTSFLVETSLGLAMSQQWVKHGECSQWGCWWNELGLQCHGECQPRAQLQMRLSLESLDTGGPCQDRSLPVQAALRGRGLS